MTLKNAYPSSFFCLRRRLQTQNNKHQPGLIDLTVESNQLIQSKNMKKIKKRVWKNKRHHIGLDKHTLRQGDMMIVKSRELRNVLMRVER
jgi:hypothetical protein